MTDNWKPQVGKPAMTNGGKTLVTDLQYSKIRTYLFYSPALNRHWLSDGRYYIGGFSSCLFQPTAEILAAHGIDADGNPVAKVEDARPPKRTPEQIVGRDAYVQLIIEDYQVTHAGQTAPSTRVDDRWFQAACAALTGVISAGGENYPNCAFDATRFADALMAEVAKREGR